MENENKVNVKPKGIKEALKSWWFWKPVTGILIGAVAGYLYFRFVGCSSGSCPITSNPYSTMFLGGLMGYLLTSGPCTKC